MSNQIPEEFICCDGMRGQSKKCSQHSFECPDNVVKYKANSRSFYLEGVNATYILSFCPWCGEKIPESLHDQRIDILEKLGIDEFDEAHIPEEYKTDTWWRMLK